MMDWPLVQVLLAILVGLLLPVVVHRWMQQRGKTAKPPGATATRQEYMQQGLSERDATFQVAVDFVAAQANAKLSNEKKLTLYAFYKQAVLGKCDADAKPSAVDMAARAKWESWMALGDMPRELAKEQYTGFVKELFPHFDESGEAHARGPHPLAEKIQDGAQDEAMGMAGVQSMPTVDLSAPEWQVKEDLFHFASTGDLAKVEAALARGGDIDAKDEGGRTMLHWAVDRSQSDVAEVLLKHKASPNVQDEEGMTPLHYAVSCEDNGLTELLVAHGAFIDMEDNDGETPLAAASTPELEAMLAKGKTQKA